MVESSDISTLPVLPPLEIEVIRSTRRRKTAQARLNGDVLEVRIPARLTATEEHDMVEHFREKFERGRLATAIDLEARASQLATQFDLPRPTTIRWVSNQKHRWGSCTPDDGSIRLSDRLIPFPQWVIEYVIVHELAHLTEYRHNDNFWALVNRYPLSERARGFLIAKGYEAC